MLLPKPLSGIIPPLATPLRDVDQIDHAGLKRLIEHVLAGGVHGLFILGTTGEGPSLSYRLRCELIELVTEQVGGRVPVLVGVTDTSATESINLAERAADSGAEAVVLAPPYYFAPNQDELLSYVRQIALQLPLPVFLYNMPALTKVNFGAELVRKAMELPQIVGLKDSSCDLRYFEQLCDLRRARPDFSLLVGPEELLADAMALGADGGVCGGANVWPELFVRLYSASEGGDSNQVRELNSRASQLGALYKIDRGAAAVIKGIKCALSCLGICDDFMAPPFERFSDENREQIRRLLAELPVAGQIAGTGNPDSGESAYAGRHEKS